MLKHTILFGLFFCLISLSDSSRSKDFEQSRGLITIKDIMFFMPSDWKLHQQAINDEIQLVGLGSGNSFLNVFVKEGVGYDLKSQLLSSVSILNEDKNVIIGPLSWDFIEASYQSSGDTGKAYVKGFTADLGGRSYYGFARSEDLQSAQSMVDTFLRGIIVHPVPGFWQGRSLTDPNYAGNKYYLGFGDSLSGSMGNEVKYDIKHTHDIFTEKVGGDYEGTKLNGSGIGKQQIVARWNEIGQQMTQDDMYVQYSSGHGSHSGLAIGVSYDEIRDNALSYPAKEIIVFIMSCYSGNLVSSFDRKKSVWENWDNEGRTLMVMASSKPSEPSETGPGTDPEEPGGPHGSAGSAFGHALWKSLIGHSDGFIDGVKDGFISLGEIREYATWKTKKISNHTPIVTGVYSPGLIMNRVPTAQFLRSLELSTEGMSEAEVMRLIKKLDEEYRVRQ